MSSPPFAMSLNGATFDFSERRITFNGQKYVVVPGICPSHFSVDRVPFDNDAVPHEVMQLAFLCANDYWAYEHGYDHERLEEGFYELSELLSALSHRVEHLTREVAALRSANPQMPNIKRERSIAAKLRYEILLRDGFKCRYCGVTAHTEALRVDHVVPVSKGGKSTHDNLVTACHPCNAGKSDMTIDGAP